MELQILFKKQGQLKDIPVTNTGKKPIMIIFGTEQPMCGQFNELMASYTFRRLDQGLEDRPSKVVAIGSRITSNLQSKGIGVDEVVQVPESVHVINDWVEQLVLMLEQWFSEEAYQSVILFNNRPVSQLSFIPVRHWVLPIEQMWLDSIQQRSWPTNNLPTYKMDPHRLLSTLTRPYIFVSIYKSFAT